MIYDVVIVSFSQISTDARTLNFVRALSELGHRTAVISLAEKAIIPKIKKTDIYHINVNTDQRMLFRWYFFIRKAGNQIKEFQTTNVIAADLYSLPVISKAFAKNYIYDSREIYSKLGNLSNRKFTQFVITQIEKYYSSVLNVIYTSGEMDSEYLKKNLTSKPKYYEIYNVPPFKNIVKSDLLREKYNIPDNIKILLYQGAVLPNRGIIPAMDFIKTRNDFVLCIIGDGYFKDKLVEKCKSSDDLKNKVFFKGNIKYNELHNWTCSADYGLALFEPVSISYELALPNKLFEYIMAGIPVIATDLKPIRNLYEKYCFGSLIPKEMKPEQIEEGLQFIEKNREVINKNIIAASREYNYENQVEKIKEIIV